jgi:hypothetical protein
MAAEEHNGGRSPSDSPTKVDHSFDDLARAMAEGSISRRRALKLFAGTAIAALIPSRALADDDDDDCVRICHVPFDRETEECDFAKAQTRCVSRRERRRHLENHPCDCRGRCANCLSPPAEPICDPPCTDAEHECAEVPGGGQTFCQPICPGCNCSCFDLADGTGVACVACEVGCPRAPNDDCSRCATDFPGTICVVTPLSTAPICCQPAA